MTDNGLHVTTAGWAATIGLVLLLLAADLFVSGRRNTAVGFREAVAWSVFYIAVAVLETWQRRGIGTALLRRLANRAREEGICRFTALMLADNRPMQRLLASLGPLDRLGSGAGTVRTVMSSIMRRPRRDPRGGRPRDRPRVRHSQVR